MGTSLTLLTTQNRCSNVLTGRMERDREEEASVCATRDSMGGLQKGVGA